ncbi:MAG: hypothetical protein K0R38_6381 [Polyangiaceae bacterium]|nr:hypothetical protein [Polyangiaceae bacterium]
MISPLGAPLPPEGPFVSTCPAKLRLVGRIVLGFPARILSPSPSIANSPIIGGRPIVLPRRVRLNRVRLEGQALTSLIPCWLSPLLTQRRAKQGSLSRD